MRICWLLFLAGLLTVGHLQAATIQYDVTGVGVSPLGNPVYRFTYTVSGVTFLTNRELAIQFDPALYGTLSNASAPPGFDVLLLQPNNPKGIAGIYSALALANISTLAPPFRVDAVYLGPGIPLGQTFSINQYASDGTFSVLDSGPAVPTGQVPEPATFASVGVMLGLIGCSWTVRRRLRRTA